MAFLVIVAVVLSVICGLAEGAITALQNAELLPNSANQIFMNNVLFVSGARSLLHCAMICRNTPGCLTFTFTPDASSSTSCRGHTTFMTSASMSVLSQSSTTFAFVPWLKDPCESNRACLLRRTRSALLATCVYSRQCLCTPGFYFSLSKHTCLAACSTADLRPAFVHYPDSQINFNNIHVSTRTLSECKALCVADSRCRSLEVVPASGICAYQSVTAKDAPADWITKAPTHQHYQITCA